MLYTLAEITRQVYTADIATAIVVASLIGGTAAVASSSIAAKASKKKGGIVQGPQDTKKTTRKDVSKKNARSALVVGDSQGVFSSPATSGRGTLLGN